MFFLFFLVPPCQGLDLLANLIEGLINHLRILLGHSDLVFLHGCMRTISLEI